MTCKEVNEFLADYLDGALPWRQRWSFKLHLVLCHNCRRYLASYVATVHVAQSLGQSGELDGEAAPNELVRAILKARSY